MKQTKPISEVVEQVCEHLYNLSVPDQTEILKENFGIEVEDTDDGVLWEGVLITDSQFDSHFMDLIENMSIESIVDIWGDFVNTPCEIDDDNNVVWDDEDEFQTFNEAPYGDD